jgi:hypothetical protein
VKTIEIKEKPGKIIEICVYRNSLREEKSRHRGKTERKRKRRKY